MNKRKIKVNAILSLIIIVLIGVLVFCIKDIIKSLKANEQTKVEILDSVEGYDYSLNENDSKYFKELFTNLKETLSKEKVDEEEYAKIISQLFITDFYSLANSLNKNDVGGIQFVYTDYQESFVKKAKETVYATVENNIYGKRNQVLPSVKEVTITDISETTFEMTDYEDEKAYEVNVKITYDEDLEYSSNATLVLVHLNNKLQIAQMK
ncbi:MAG: hypothetical protein PHQ89_05495 [Bacilli bacterium]|nr:hypothetical protein [Bacilli bacterium]